MKKPQKKQMLFGLIIVVVLGVSVTAAVLFSQYQASIRPIENEKTQTPPVQKPVVEKKADEAVKKAFEGDVDGGAAELDRAIEATDDSNEKYIFYSHKATLLYNNNKLPDALAAALKAFEFKQSSDSAALVGQFSSESGNKAQAIEYYKKAITLINKTDPYWDEDTDYYNSLVRELEGGASNG